MINYTLQFDFRYNSVVRQEWILVSIVCLEWFGTYLTELLSFSNSVCLECFRTSLTMLSFSFSGFYRLVPLGSCSMRLVSSSKSVTVITPWLGSLAVVTTGCFVAVVLCCLLAVTLKSKHNLI